MHQSHILIGNSNNAFLQQGYARKMGSVSRIPDWNTILKIRIDKWIVRSTQADLVRQKHDLRVTPWPEWGYLDNTKHLIFWLCNMKQLNFRHVNTNSKKFFETVNFFHKEAKTAPKELISFQISEGYRGLPKIVKDFRRLTNRSDHCRRCPKNPSNT